MSINLITPVSSNKSGLFSSEQNSSFGSRSIKNFDDLGLKLLDNHSLDDFFLFYDKSLSQEEKRSKNPSNLKPTDLFHYIWMGNPLKKDYQDNILKLKELYPDKKFILWVDDLALKNNEILNFAKDNNICVILLDAVFKENNNFGLDEILKIEKNRIPPNWGAVSDIYRYLIEYYFAGTYLDTDCDPYTVPIFLSQKKIETLDKDISKNYRNNDIIIVKNRNNPFFLEIFEEIKKRYQCIFDYEYWNENKHFFKFLNFFRGWSTVYRTGPQLFAKNPNFFYIEMTDAKTDFGWRGTLTDNLIEKLIKNSNIETNIALNIIQELKERKILNLIRYDAIINKLPIDARRRILNQIISELQKFLKDNPNFDIQHLIAKNKEEYEEFIQHIPEVNKNIKSHFLALKKAIKTKNIEMIHFLINFLDKEKIDISDLIAKAFLYLYHDDKKILNIMIEAISEKKISIDLEKIIWLIILLSTDAQIKNISSKDLEEFVENLKINRLVSDNFKIEDMISKIVKHLIEISNYIWLHKITKNEQLSEWIYNKLNSELQKNVKHILIPDLSLYPYRF